VGPVRVNFQGPRPKKGHGGWDRLRGDDKGVVTDKPNSKQTEEKKRWVQPAPIQTRRKKDSVGREENWRQLNPTKF